MNCWKVRVKTTNGCNKTTIDPDDNYISCQDGFIFVVTKSLSDIEKVVKPEWIKSAELVGVGAIAIKK